ncbi:hypothetical protein ACH5RR_037278 [Cinchona calisaya]|uniref:Uncharacterized protein n=1 Tax=Cinchona calisaya TaxID=153742 RepID=A0ABD2Y5Q1_9GENT
MNLEVCTSQMATKNTPTTSLVDGESEHLKVRVPIISLFLGTMKEDLHAIKDYTSKYVKSPGTCRVHLGIESRQNSISKASKFWSSSQDKDSYIASIMVAPVMTTSAISIEG